MGFPFPSFAFLIDDTKFCLWSAFSFHIHNQSLLATNFICYSWTLGDFANLQADIKNRRKLVKALKKKSLWSRSFEEVASNIALKSFCLVQPGHNFSLLYFYCLKLYMLELWRSVGLPKKHIFFQELWSESKPLKKIYLHKPTLDYWLCRWLRNLWIL